MLPKEMQVQLSIDRLFEGEVSYQCSTCMSDCFFFYLKISNLDF
jgi:hypothetical protein